MSIQSEITRINQNVSAAYDAVEAKGGTLPTTQDSGNLATAINSIEGGGVPQEVEDFLLNGVTPTVDENSYWNSKTYCSTDFSRLPPSSVSLPNVTELHAPACFDLTYTFPVIIGNGAYSITNDSQKAKSSLMTNYYRPIFYGSLERAESAVINLTSMKIGMQGFGVNVVVGSSNKNTHTSFVFPKLTTATSVGSGSPSLLSLKSRILSQYNSGPIDTIYCPVLTNGAYTELFTGGTSYISSNGRPGLDLKRLILPEAERMGMLLISSKISSDTSTDEPLLEEIYAPKLTGIQTNNGTNYGLYYLGGTASAAGAPNLKRIDIYGIGAILYRNITSTEQNFETLILRGPLSSNRVTSNNILQSSIGTRADIGFVYVPSEYYDDYAAHSLWGQLTNLTIDGTTVNKLRKIEDYPEITHLKEFDARGYEITS